MVGSLSCWRMGCASRAQGERASEAVDGVSVEMDLQYRDIEKSASAAISLCALDESDDRHADLAPIRHQAQCDLGGSIVGANGVELPKAAERAFEQDATLVKQWIERNFPKICALAKKERAVVFFADESGVRSDFHAGTTWGYAAPCCPPHWQTLSSQYAVCDLSQRRTAVHDLAEAALSGAVHRVPAPVDHKLSEKIFLVVDGLPAHKAKSVHRFVHQVKDRLRLFFLPPYSPEINPDELVWNDVKNHGVARTLIRAPRDLHRAVSSRLRLLQKNPGKVRAFFQMETTRYAAA